jgi:UDP-GlcNAc:undecaprenyl-phosphate/decaprenyl-phosphate GlcNAc-1-phosphate transferase
VTVCIATVVGIIAAMLFAVVLRDVLDAPILRRTNYRGAALTIGGGLVAIVAGLFSVAAVSITARMRDVDGALGAWGLIALFVFIGFAALGFIDDTVGNGDSRGFRGHIRALFRGHITTGAIKLFGGVAVAWIAIDRRELSASRVVVGVAVIALCANLCNLFDRAPARTLKVGALAWLILGFVATIDAHTATSRASLVIAALCIGSCLGLLPFDASERMMLGDAGANALGSVLGVVVVFTQSFGVQVGVLSVVVALNAVSEFVSFSAAIQRSRWLDWLDRYGTARHSAAAPFDASVSRRDRG